jgi:hypothetical protein
MYMVKLINKQMRDEIPNKLNREVLNDTGNIAFRWCLGLLRSCFYSSAPPTPQWTSSTKEFVEQVVLIDTQPSFSSRNGLFSYKWSIMPLIEIVYALYVPCMYADLHYVCLVFFSLRVD